MGNITSMDALVAAMPGERFALTKASISASAGFFSLWAATGVPSAGATAAACGAGGEIPTKSTAGAIPFTDPGATEEAYLARLAYANSLESGLILWDRLWAASGFNFTSVSGAQAVTGPPALTRPDATGEGAELWLETLTSPTGIAITLTATYTNSAGTPGRTATCTASTFAGVGKAFRFDLQAGDTGVASVQSVISGAAPGTVGAFQLVIARRLAEIGAVGSNLIAERNAIDLGLPRVDAGACLYGMVYTGSTTSGVVYGSGSIVKA